MSRDVAAAEMRRNGTLIAAMLVRDGEADGMLCGTFGAYATHLRYVADVIGLREGANGFAAMNLLLLPRHTRLHLRHLRQPRPDAPSRSPR